MRWIYFSAPGICAAALFLGACSQVSKPSAVAVRNIADPANPRAVGGRAIPQTDFLNISQPAAQIAQPSVLILNRTTGTAPASTSKSDMHGMKGMKMNSMPGMNMKGDTQ